MLEKHKKIQICITDENKCALWESGGCTGKTGTAVIIANSNGTPKKPILIKQRGNIKNAQHALLKIGISDIVAYADYVVKDSKFNLDLYRVVSIDPEHSEALLEKFASFDNDANTNDAVSMRYNLLIKAAQRKAATVCCKNPTYVVGIS